MLLSPWKMRTFVSAGNVPLKFSANSYLAITPSSLSHPLYSHIWLGLAFPKAGVLADCGKESLVEDLRRALSKFLTFGCHAVMREEERVH